MICEDKVQEPKIREKEFSNKKVEIHLKCDVCNSVFKTKPNLKRHIESVHKGNKNLSNATFVMQALHKSIN